MRRVNPALLTWLLRIFPPFLFQRIWVRKVEEGFRGIEVKIFKSVFNLNSNRTIFGGTIFSALDPLHPLLLDQIFKLRGMRQTVAWLKSARIEFLKPGHSTLTIAVRLTDEQIEEAYQTILSEGKVIRTFTTEVVDKNGMVCALMHSEVYIRDRSFAHRSTAPAKTVTQLN